MKLEINKNFTYFIISDIHNFYDEMKAALKTAGFEESNKNHIVICAGDFFDRKKTQAKELLNWIKKMLSLKRLIWIRGNHEDLLIKALNRNYPHPADFSNGTVSTMCQLADVLEATVNDEKVFINMLFNSSFNKLSDKEKYNKAFEEAQKNWFKVTNKLNALKIRKFIEQNTVNFIELGKYVIVHSFIPLRENNYFPSWRQDSTYEEWYNSRWGNPFELIKEGKFKPESQMGRILVFGHWTVAEGRAIMENKSFDWYDEKNDHSMFVDKEFIALDGTTVLSKKVNVLKLEGKNLIKKEA